MHDKAKQIRHWNRWTEQVVKYLEYLQFSLHFQNVLHFVASVKYSLSQRIETVMYFEFLVRSTIARYFKKNSASYHLSLTVGNIRPAYCFISRRPSTLYLLKEDNCHSSQLCGAVKTFGGSLGSFIITFFKILLVLQMLSIIF